MKTLIKSGIFLYLFSVASIAFGAIPGGITIGISGGTLGLGGGVGVAFGDYVNVRFGLNTFSYTMSDYEYSDGDMDLLIDGDLQLRSYALLADVFPFRRVLKLTGGIIFYGNALSASIRPNETYEVGGDLYTPDKLGRLDTDLGFSETAAYLGIGLGNAPTRPKGLGATFDIGGVYQGSPTVKLTGNGLLEPTATPDQEETIEESIKGFTWWPVASVGLFYTFSL